MVEKRLQQAQSLIQERSRYCFEKLSWNLEIQKYAEHVVGSGKTLRPALLFWSWQQLSHNQQSTPPLSLQNVATALEWIHTYSLVHDDLPCMDNDAFRRGRPTIHHLSNEATALLVGDSLLTGAFEILSQEDSFSALTKIAMIRELATAAGAAGMIAGQAMDMFPQENSATYLEKIHLHKTGALFGATLTLGALAAWPEASQKFLEPIKIWGQKLGLLFQMVDDFLDATSSSQALGKTAGKDFHQNKVSYVNFWGLEKTKKEIQNLQDTLLSSNPFGKDSEIEIKNWLHFICERKK